MTIATNAIKLTINAKKMYINITVSSNSSNTKKVCINKVVIINENNTKKMHIKIASIINIIPMTKKITNTNIMITTSKLIKKNRYQDNDNSQ